MGRELKLANRRFGRLIVKQKLSEKTLSGTYKWLCVCDCGNELNVIGSSLVNGTTQSCGCLALEKATKHGFSRLPEYHIWINMKQRCFNTKHQNYDSYGGRGITVCERWRNSFEDFLNDMGFRPGKNYSIDRRNNNGNYDPKNCYWATYVEQNNNTRSNVTFDIQGKIYTYQDILKEFKIKENLLRYRLHSGLSIEEAINKTVREAKIYTYNGISGTLSEWSKILKVPIKVLYNRIYALGWSFEKCVSRSTAAADDKAKAMVQSRLDYNS